MTNLGSREEVGVLKEGQVTYMWNPLSPSDLKTWQWHFVTVFPESLLSLFPFFLLTELTAMVFWNIIIINIKYI